MKKITIILTAITALLLISLSACTQTNTPTNENSLENATITLERTGMFTMPEYVIQRITIDNKGLTYETFSYENESTNSVYTQFKSDEYQQLITILENNNFFNLEDEYNSSVQVADIGQGIITVTTPNNEKSILINPYIQDSNPAQITNIMTKLDELINNANSPFEQVISLTYQGLQCEDEPWDVWYSEGNIKFIKAPTEQELIIAYYSSKNIEIKNIEEFSAGIVCQACSVCPDSNYYVATINQDNKDILIADGWTE